MPGMRWSWTSRMRVPLSRLGDVSAVQRHRQSVLLKTSGSMTTVSDDQNANNDGSYNRCLALPSVQFGSVSVQATRTCPNAKPMPEYAQALSFAIGSDCGGTRRWTSRRSVAFVLPTVVSRGHCLWHLSPLVADML